MDPILPFKKIMEKNLSIHQNDDIMTCREG